MATLDDILGGGKPNNEGGVQNQDNKAGGNTSGGSNSTASTTPPAKTTTPQSQPEQPKSAPTADNATSGGGYEELFRQLNPYKPPTAEELEKEKKKQKRDEIFAAIGDGIAALSNLYFTTKGAPSMYDGKNSMSAATKVRYDKLKKEHEDKNATYFNGLMKARAADIAADTAAAKEKQLVREWQRKLGLDQEARDKYKESIEHRNEREAIDDERYNKEQAQKAEERELKQQQRAEDNARKDRDYNLKVRQHNDNTETRRQRNAATAARGVRGKRIGFSDGGDNNIGIYENVWKGSMQGIFDTLKGELLADLSDTRVNNKYDTPQKKEDFVKQNWWKSETAKAQMRALSKLDPSLMTAEDNDEIIDYVPGGGSSDDEEEEIIDYVPGKK